MTCKHQQIRTWVYEDTKEPSGLWSCVDCGLKFEPITQRTEQEPVMILPDGSAFGVMSFPLPDDHWLYAPNEYRDGEYEPIDLPKPILTHALRDAVVAAVRYAVRGATMRGQETDFDPDALVQNAVYALCGPYTTPSQPVAWKLMPRDATNAMLKAMDECSTEGYDERLYAGHAASVYMAAWDEAPTPPQPEQEPVAHLWECIGRWSAYLVSNGKQANCAPPSWLVDAVNNATAPPQRTWVGLTEVEADKIYKDGSTFGEMMRMVEAKLKEKNGFAEEKNT